MKSRYLKRLFFVIVVVNSSMFFACTDGVVKNNDFKITVNRNELVISRIDGSSVTLKPEFTLIYTNKDPQKALRYGDHGYQLKPHEQKDLGILYHVPTWGRSEDFKIDSEEHVMDGFNPEIDRIFGEGRTANMFLAGETVMLKAIETKVNNNVVEWIFPDNDFVSLRAYITIEEGDDYPSLSYDFIAKKTGYFSLGYTGAPKYEIDECSEIWQSDIWSEKRFPNAPYISEAYRTKVPATFVAKSGTTYGFVGAPEYVPFMPMPTTRNSQFGLMVRNVNGLAQSSIFAPVLGGTNSKMNIDDNNSFKAYIYVVNNNIDKAFEETGRRIYEFSDIRRNTTVTLNKTFENMVDYCMSTYASFNDELRGCDYSSDVPGAVKNISGLHPLSIAFITDNQEIYTKRALPMLEYGLTRERFLFSTNPEIKRDGTSSKLKGPGVPLSDLSTTYTFSGNRMTHFLEVAKGIYHNKVNRSLNLDAMLWGDRWQNAMALYRATGEQKYLDDAIRKADEYLEERFNTVQTDFNDNHSQGLFFWTSYANHFMELYLMYKTTGDKKYLEAAHKGARMYARFCWMSPRIPKGEVTVNKGGVVPHYRTGDRWITMRIPEESVEAWRVSEHGLTPESTPTCNGHRAIFMPHHAPFMMNIAAETGDKFLHDIARNAVIGRYENFPGYHINAERTTAFEKYDFPLRSFEELNGHTSMHYNHPWSMVTSLMDYMMAEAYYASDKQIDMNPEYSEGYAYCRSLIFGKNKGTFYGDKDVIPYMPKGLLETDNLQLNYIAARGNDKLYVAFTNQFTDEIDAKVTFNLEQAGLEKGKMYHCQVWKNNVAAENITLKDGVLNVEVSPKGITAIAILGAEPKAGFQKALEAPTHAWSKDFSNVGFEDDNAVIFNMGEGLVSAYFMTAANNDVFKKVTVSYRIDNAKWQNISRAGYPYEFTISVPDDAEKIEYQFEGVTVNGKIRKSEIGYLQK